ncbi:hypothetical protein H7X87_01225 [Acetobacteraceae bacterium]|nr:hypothetical protein [Candidatus Parcubacteria bacterium]
MLNVDQETFRDLVLIGGTIAVAVVLGGLLLWGLISIIKRFSLTFIAIIVAGAMVVVLAIMPPTPEIVSLREGAMVIGALAVIGGFAIDLFKKHNEAKARQKKKSHKPNKKDLLAQLLAAEADEGRGH